MSSRSGQLVLSLRRWRERWFPSGSRQGRFLDQGLRSLGWRWLSGVDRQELRAYQAWRARQAPSASDLERQRQTSATFPHRPLISIITPTYNTPVDALRAMLDSVLAQSYPHWELCLVDGGSSAPAVPALLQDYASRDARLRVRRLANNLGIAGNSNVALEMAQGEFVALLDHDDVLEPHALFAVAEALNRQPETDVIYSDHDVLSADGQVTFHPVFKPSWSPETMLSANYLTHLTVLRTALVREIGGFAPDTDGAQDWDLFLRMAEKTSRIVHLPVILYHWRSAARSTARDIRAKPKVPQTQLRVIERHLARQGLINPRARFDAFGFIRVNWTFDRARFVSIIVPSRGANALLERCIQSILARTAYPCLEIVVVNNGPQPPAAFDYYERITRDPRVRVVHDERPFNYSAANNLGARLAKGDLLLFLNNDTEVMASDWLDELAMWAARPAVGLVGAKLLFPNGRIQHAGVVLGLTGFAGHLFAGADEGQESCFGWAEWYRNFLSVTAACLLTRRDVFERLGGFDEEFVLCGSDVALGLRAHDLGYRVVYNPFARIRHDESATHRGAIPSADFKTSLRRYRPWLVSGDPYFNANLSYWQTVPALRQPNEPDQLTFAVRHVAALDTRHDAP
ncbi:MAG: glycosyltransferase family 2 protein [bacterium]